MLGLILFAGFDYLSLFFAEQKLQCRAKMNEDDGVVVPAFRGSPWPKGMLPVSRPTKSSRVPRCDICHIIIIIINSELILL